MELNSAQQNLRGRDLESQLSKPTSIITKRSLWWTAVTDVPLILICSLLIGIFELGVIPSHKAGFFCGDLSLSFPFTGDTVSMTALMLSVIFLPIVVIYIKEAIFIDSDFITSSRFYQALRSTSWLYRNYAYGLFFNLGIVEVIKGITGSPRPTFFDICKPDTLLTCKGSEFVNTYQCTSKLFSSWFQSDAAHSFPSGHASLSIYCGLFLVWYLQRRAFSWRHQSVFLVPVIQLFLVTYSSYCALTRITDHRHHWWDVLAGAVLAVVCLFYAVLVLCKNFKDLKPLSDVSSVDVQQSRTLLIDRQRVSGFTTLTT